LPNGEIHTECLARNSSAADFWLDHESETICFTSARCNSPECPVSEGKLGQNDPCSAWSIRGRARWRQSKIRCWPGFGQEPWKTWGWKSDITQV